MLPQKLPYNRLVGGVCRFCVWPSENTVSGWWSGWMGKGVIVNLMLRLQGVKYINCAKMVVMVVMVIMTLFLMYKFITSWKIWVVMIVMILTFCGYFWDKSLIYAFGIYHYDITKLGFFLNVSLTNGLLRVWRIQKTALFGGGLR